MKESDTKGYTMYGFIYMTFWESQNYRNKNQMSGYQGLDAEKGRITKKGTRELLGMMGNVLRISCGDDYMTCNS